MTPKILVRVRDDAHARIAWAVASLPGVGRIGMLGQPPPSSWRKRVRRASESHDGDIVVDPDPDDRGVAVVAGPGERPGITHAGPEGLARSLAVRMGDSAIAAWTVEGKPIRRGPSWPFPPPVGVVRGPAEGSPVVGRFAAAGAFGTKRSIVCVDDRPFMQAVCMAAGAAVAAEDTSRPTPVWERAEDYLAACEELGLVFAEGISS